MGASRPGCPALLLLVSVAAAAQAAARTITTVAGTGAKRYTADNGPATSARLCRPAGVTRLAGGGFLIADTAAHRILKASPRR